MRATQLAALPWTGAARSLQARVAFLRAVAGEPWPDLSDAALRRSLDDWLAPLLAGATGRAALDRLDLPRVLRGLVPPQVAGDLDRLAPEALAVPTGRRVRLDYGRRPRRPAGAGRAGPGHVRRPRDAHGGRRPGPGGAAPAVAGRAAGAGHERPGGVLGGVVARGPQGDGGPVPEARLADRSGPCPTPPARPGSGRRSGRRGQA